MKKASIFSTVYIIFYKCKKKKLDFCLTRQKCIYKNKSNQVCKNSNKTSEKLKIKSENLILSLIYAKNEKLKIGFGLIMILATHYFYQFMQIH